MGKSIQGNYKNLKFDNVASLRGVFGSKKGETADVLGHTTPGDGGGGPPRIWDEGQVIGFYVDDDGETTVPGDGSSAWITDCTDPVNALTYGAKVGVNSTIAINKANLYAEAKGREFYIPPGEFLGFGILPKVPWKGVPGRSILKSTNDTTVAFDFCKVESVLNWACYGITFDGDSSADPLVWDASTYNDFTGSIPLYLLFADDFVIDNCVFQNSRSAALRVESSNTGTVINSRTNRSRAQFGDGIYFTNCDEMKVIACKVDDVQRIGVVAENGCEVIDISDTTVTLADHQGIDFGGTEINSGFWAENSTEINMYNCRAINTNTNGFFFSTGSSVSLMNTASSRATDCTAINVVTPFTAESGGGTPHKATFINCRAYGTSTGISFDAGNETDNYAAISCHVQIDLSKSPSIARAYSFLSRDAHTVAPQFSFIDCTTDYLNYSVTDFEDNALNTADVGPFATTGSLNALAYVVIRNVTSIREDRRIFIKARSGRLRYNISDGFYDIRAVNMIQGDSYITNSKINYIEMTNGLDPDSNITISDCHVIGRVTINTKGFINLHDSSIDMDSDRMAFGIQENTKFPAIELRDNVFTKDITVSDFVIQINYTSVNAPLSTIANNTFVNTNATPPAASATFIRFPQSTNSFVFSNTIMDANVNDLYVQSVTTGTPADTTDIVFH